MSSNDIPGINWSANRMLPAFQAPKHLTIYDLRGASQDVQISAATMAGLINRPQPQAYLIFNNDDDFWLKELLGGIPQETAPVTGNDVPEGMLITFRSSTKGMVIYDPNIVDSINIATMIASQRDAIVVSPAQAQDLQQPHNLPVLDDLRTQNWNNRLQAYTWAEQNLLNGMSAHALAGLDPKYGGLRSFLVANRIFVYWLDSRSAEQNLMKQIYGAFSPGAVHLGWFIDEPSGVQLTSNAALPVLATDLFNNLEVWTSVQPTTAIAQPKRARPTGSIDSSKVYVSFTISDGDNLQYIQHRLLQRWQDPARGSSPIGWTISPALAQAAPAMAAYYVRTAKPSDEFIAGPSGAGYMYPSQWPQQHLPAFLQLTEQMMRSMNLTTLEVLDISDDTAGETSILDILKQAISTLVGLVPGASVLEILQQVIPTLVLNISDLKNNQPFSNADLQARFIQALSSVGLNGILSSAGIKVPGVTFSSGGVPVYYNLGLANGVQATLDMIKNAALILKQRPLFLNVYILTWAMVPSDIKKVVQQLGNGYEVVTPGTLLGMIAQEHPQKH